MPGPLEKLHIHVKKEDGDAFTKANEATKAILDSIASSTTPPPSEGTTPTSYRAPLRR